MHADFDANQLNEPSLKDLRERIKKAMIPLLIKTFELKLAAQQAESPPSRLQKKSSRSSEEIIEELKSLQNDLHQLNLWTVTAQRQVEKALNDTAQPLAPKKISITPPPTKLAPFARLKRWVKR